MAGAPVSWLVGVWARRIQWRPFKLLRFNYLFALYLLEGEAGGVGETCFLLRKIAHLLMIKIKDLLLMFITGDFPSQETPWEAY